LERSQNRLGSEKVDAQGTTGGKRVCKPSKDVHSPASGSQVLRLLPTIYLMLTAVDGIDQEEIQIGSLDIKDAFLMADQEEPLQITTKVGKFKVKKNLPGQRKAPRSWYEFIANYLEKKGGSFCPENPCLGKRGGGLYLL
jgi:hypothetical protein